MHAFYLSTSLNLYPCNHVKLGICPHIYPKYKSKQTAWFFFPLVLGLDSCQVIWSQSQCLLIVGDGDCYSKPGLSSLPQESWLLLSWIEFRQKQTNKHFWLLGQASANTSTLWFKQSKVLVVTVPPTVIWRYHCFRKLPLLQCLLQNFVKD